MAASPWSRSSAAGPVGPDPVVAAPAVQEARSGPCVTGVGHTERMDDKERVSAPASPESRAEQIDGRRRKVLQQLADLDEELDALRRTREGLSDDDEHDPDGVPLSAQWSRLEGLKQR